MPVICEMTSKIYFSHSSLKQCHLKNKQNRLATVFTTPQSNASSCGDRTSAEPAAIRYTCPVEARNFPTLIIPHELNLGEHDISPGRDFNQKLELASGNRSVQSKDKMAKNCCAPIKNKTKNHENYW